VTLFDYVVVAILAASILISVLRGLVREVFSLLSWIAAFVVASQFASSMARMLPDALSGATLRYIVGFLVLLVGMLILGALVSAALGLLIKASGLVIADKGLGGLFGLARGIVIIMTAVILAGLTEMPRQPFWRDSISAPIAEEAVRRVKPFLPPSWAEHVHF
jgi:membrane protein required for colicin V production